MRTTCTWPEGCAERAMAGEPLCYYHGKVEAGVLNLPDGAYDREQRRDRRRRDVLQRADRQITAAEAAKVREHRAEYLRLLAEIDRWKDDEGDLLTIGELRRQGRPLNDWEIGAVLLIPVEDLFAAAELLSLEVEMHRAYRDLLVDELVDPDEAS